MFLWNNPARGTTLAKRHVYACEASGIKQQWIFESWDSTNLDWLCHFAADRVLTCNTLGAMGPCDFFSRTDFLLQKCFPVGDGSSMSGPFPLNARGCRDVRQVNRELPLALNSGIFVKSTYTFLLVIKHPENKGTGHCEQLYSRS